MLRTTAQRLTGSLLALLIAITGCNGGDDDGSSRPSPTATVSSSTATPVPTGTTAEASPTPSQTPATTSSRSATPTPSTTPRTPPNIVFIILDDVGIDQMQSFGLGEGVLASTPNLDALASSGVRFSNVWSMPECSPSRATIFTGRYPLRTGVTSALIPNMLPQAQVSPYETTLPRVLAQVGYTSAMVGKYHLGNRNPAGNCSPRTTGFDFFDGNMEAGPPSIDTQAGEVGGSVPDLSCGFEQRMVAGNCYFADGSCRADVVPVPAPGGGTEPAPVNGPNCVQAGGVLVEETGDCQDTTFVSCPDGSGRTNCVEVGGGATILDFTRPNGYYAWPQTIAEGVLPPGTTDFSDAACGEPPLDRVYMTIAQTSDSIAWYNEQSGPRMLTVSYNSIHTPYQQAPISLADIIGLDEFQCSTVPDDRVLGDNMLESMDREIGRLLAQLNLATVDANGTIQTVVDGDGHTQIPELRASNTMVVVVGDNGSFFEVAKLPFDPLRSKGTVYQTGVWVPLIVAGPKVEGPTGREVDAMVNVADLFALFAEFAGIDPDEAVPPAHTLDSEPMLAYLTNLDQEPIRQFNFTQLGPGVFESPVNEATRSWPCVLVLPGLGSECNDVISQTQSFCSTNGGVWWGPSDDPDEEVVQVLGDDASQGLPSCCAVLAAIADSGLDLDMPAQGPLEQFAVRNETFKLVERLLPDCSMDDGSFPPDNLRMEIEFYDLTPTGSDLNPLGIDVANNNLACAVRKEGADPTCQDGSSCEIEAPASCIAGVQLDNYNGLQAELMRLMSSQQPCEGDGNLDQHVDQLDADGVIDFSSAVSALTGVVGDASVFDLNTDAKTDDLDGQIVADQLGTDCIGDCHRSDLNRDGFVDGTDVNLLRQQFGPCELCGADLNNDGVVNEVDQAIQEEQVDCSSPTETPTPLPTEATPTPRDTPTPRTCNDQCIPDAVDRQCGCGLFVPGETMLPPDSGIDCDEVCREYSVCLRGPGPYELGYTCDATLCTSREVDLVTEACFGIETCELDETLRAERAAGCSCCASQLCGCTPSDTTNEEVRILDQQQRERGETPQCDINGTLCGGEEDDG